MAVVQMKKNQVVTNEDTAKKATEQEDKPQTKRREDVQDKPPQPSDPKVIAQEDSKQEMQQTKSIQAEENTDTKTMTTEKIIKSEAAKEDNTKLKATEHKPELEVLPNSSN